MDVTIDIHFRESQFECESYLLITFDRYGPALTNVDTWSSKKLSD